MAFTTTSVEELGCLTGEPDWLRARRRDAFATYERLPLPSRSDEEWRRTDIRGLNLEAFEAFERADGAAPSDPIDEVAGVLRQRGSEPGVVELDPSLAPRGVLFMPLTHPAKHHPTLVPRLLFTEVKPYRDTFSAVPAALFSGGPFLFVPDGVTLDKPLVSQFWSSGGGAAVLPHTLIVAGRGSSFNYVDEFLSPDLDRPALTSGSAEGFAGEAASVGYLSLQRWGRHAWPVADQPGDAG